MGTRPHKSRAAPNMRVFYDFLVKSSSRYQSGKQKWCPRLSFLKFWSQVQPELLLQSGGHFADLVWCKSSSGYRPVHIFVGIEPWTAEQRPSFGDPGSRVTRKKQGFHTRECFSPMNSHVPDLLYSPLLLPHMNCPCSLRGWHHDHIMAWWWHDGDQLMTRWEVVHNSEAFKLYKFLLISISISISISIYIDIDIHIDLQKGDQGSAPTLNTINFFNAVCTMLFCFGIQLTLQNQNQKKTNQWRSMIGWDIGLVFFVFSMFSSISLPALHWDQISSSGLRCVYFHMSACRNQLSKKNKLLRRTSLN